MALCEIHELDGDAGSDDRYCVKCGTPEFAITALADAEAKLDGLVNKFGGNGQAYQGPQFWQDRVDSIGRALTESNNQMAIEKRNHLDTSNWALEQQNRADLSENALADAKQWVDIYRMLRNVHKHFRRILSKSVADLEEDSAPFRSQIDQRKTYKVNTAKHEAANDLFDAVKDEWVE